MFAERGFDEVTVDEIVAAADVSHRTFYRYFPSKEDVVLGDHDGKVEAFSAAVRDRPADETPFEALRAAVLDFADAYEQSKDLDGGRAKVISDTPCLSLRVAERQVAWELALAPVIAERLGVDPDTDMRPRLLTACAVGAMRAAIDQWVAAGPTTSLRDLVDQAFAILAAGFEATSAPAASGTARTSATPRAPGRPGR